MKKHNDSIWKQLSPEQTELLHRWLLEQNLTYEQVKTRLLYEWNLTVSTSSLCRYYQSLMSAKLEEDFAKVKMALKATQQADLDLDGLLSGALTLMSKRLVTGDSKEVARLAGLLLQYRQQEIQRGWLKLADEKFHFNSAREVLKQLPFAEQIKQEKLDLEEKQMLELLVRLFGTEVLSRVVMRPSSDPNYRPLFDPKTIKLWPNIPKPNRNADGTVQQPNVEQPKPEATVQQPNVAEANQNVQPTETVAKPVENATDVTH